MATVITEECINCGACEPECPNTAIYQGGVEYDWQGEQKALSEDFFYIVPEKCTECVGFFDQEACAAVCPVDCCVPDPARPESEEVLLVRAKQLHPDNEFPADFASRFKDGGGAPAGDAAKAAPAPVPVPAAAPAPAPPVPSAAPAPAPAPVAGSTQSAAPATPAAARLEDYEVPIPCRSCDSLFTVAYKFLTPGTVLRCPVCQTSFAPTQRMYLAVGKRLETYADSYNAEVDRHNDLTETEERRFAANTKKVRDAVDCEVAEILADLTEPPKKSMFG